MSLVLALKNHDGVVVASDVQQPTADPLAFGQFLNVPGRAILLLAGNIEAIRRPILDRVVPRLTPQTTAAVLAQLVQAALVLDVMPKLAQIPGRIEVIVAGIDPVRHTEEPGLYYLDSASDFHLMIVAENAIAAGSTAVAKEILASRDLSAVSIDGLTTIAKECLAATKLRWPEVVAPHQRLGIITTTQTRILDF